MKGLRRFFSKKSHHLYHQSCERNHIVNLFEDMEQCVGKKRRLEYYLEELLKKEALLKKYERLGESDLTKLVALVDRRRGIEEKKDFLKGRLVENNAALNRLEPFEQELPQMIKELGAVERKVKESERDLFYLEEEYEELREDRETLLFGYKFLKGFSVMVLGLLVVMLFVMFALLQTLRETVWLYVSGVCCLVVFFVVLIVLLKDTLEKKLRDNEILQKKAVRYSNKIKIRAFHNKNYLQFQFAKLGVDSVSKLELYYNRYLGSKSDEKSYAHLTRALVQVEEEIEDVFEMKGLGQDEFGAVAEWFVVPKRVKVLQQTIGESDKIRAQIETLDTYAKDLWKEIQLLKEEPILTEMIERNSEVYEEVRLMLDKKQKSE